MPPHMKYFGPIVLWTFVFSSACYAGMDISQPDAKQPASTASDSDQTSSVSPAEASKPALKIPGLPTERQQVSYMIGLNLAQGLKQLDNEVDVAVFNRAFHATLNGDPPLMTDEQLKQVLMPFQQLMGAKRQAELKATAKRNLVESAQFLSGNAKQPDVRTTPSGLQYKVLVEGTGAKLSPQSNARMRFKGSLLNGKILVSSSRGLTSKEHEAAVLTMDDMVPGLKEGVQLMPIGSTYIFWIPPSLGFGGLDSMQDPQQQPPPFVEPEATLKIEVELLGEVPKETSKDAPPVELEQTPGTTTPPEATP